MKTEETKASHTPGPWVAALDMVTDVDSGVIAKCVWGDREMAFANARLISEAPNMAKLLAQLVRWNKNVNGDGTELDKICAMAEKIAAKASGSARVRVTAPRGGR